jgi:hypothetical protein
MRAGFTLSGVLAQNGVEFGVQVRLQLSLDGVFEGTLDNLGAGCIGIPLTSIDIQASVVRRPWLVRQVALIYEEPMSVSVVRDLNTQLARLR